MCTLITHTSLSPSQEMNQAIIRNHLSQQFNLAGVSFERATVTCSSDSSYGIFNFVLRGEEAQQVAAEMRQQRIPDLTLNNGQTVTLKVCANECSLEGASIASSPISLPAGVIVAAMFILVVVACLALLIVILMKYRRWVNLAIADHVLNEVIYNIKEMKQALKLHALSFNVRGMISKGAMFTEV